ncbi:2OG-Fe(II) oxygenase, partial [Pseudooceanicola sp. HF7]|uniref:2OG-Fe(II) oxygenase n=1 Tax=Pseudooceanicola sp. HF7 TaxID=2721560 RepID=UPI0014304699
MLALHVIPQAFSLTECATLSQVARTAPAQDAGLVRQARDHNLRRAELVWLDEVPDNDWVMDRLIDLVRQANRESFDFDLQDFSESPQLARYGSDRQGHFDWHSDIGDGRLAAKRKLTLVT